MDENCAFAPVQVAAAVPPPPPVALPPPDPPSLVLVEPQLHIVDETTATAANIVFM
jgi:hypothetical protein